MKPLVAVLTLTMIGGMSGHVLADNKDIAREAYREASREYDLGDYKSALAAFKKAYLNYEDSSFLYNIAQCERQLGDKAEALHFYRVYLHKVPASPMRVQVEKIVEELQASVDLDKSTPKTTVEPTVPAAPPPATPADTISPATAAVLVAPAPVPPKPLVKRGWFWGAVVGGAVVVAGAITLGVVLGRPSHHYDELTY
jgi:tetratricopeptide (TPR) repeat protein